RALMASGDFLYERNALNTEPLVDYRKAAVLKRDVLQHLARQVFRDGGGRLQRLLAFAQENPRFEDYARFRATVEKTRQSWWVWPERLRGGDLQPGDWDEDARRYHLYVQWLAHEQLA